MRMKNKRCILTLLLCCFLFINPLITQAATLGKSLYDPEQGWRRYDDLDTNFYYKGSWGSTDNGSIAFYKGEIKYTDEGTVKFKFRGSKLRIMAQIYNSRSERIQVEIDNKIVGEYSLYDPKLYTNQCLNYEIQNLDYGVHYVTLKNLTEKRFLFDAIDIDSTGELLPYDRIENSSNLKALGGNSKIDLTWEAVDRATSYNVKRAITTGGPYTTIAADITDTSYTDNDVINGTTYYYIVSAVNTGTEMSNSNEASAEATTTPPTTETKLKVVLEVSEALRLSVDNDLNVNTQMVWESSDKTVATVNEKGIVTALAPGNTVITVKSVDGSYTDYINILVVENADDYRLAIDLKVGEIARLTVDDFTNTANVTWAPMDSSIANVTSKGKVTALSKGLVLMTAKDNEGNVVGRIYIRVRE